PSDRCGNPAGGEVGLTKSVLQRMGRPANQSDNSDVNCASQKQVFHRIMRAHAADNLFQMQCERSVAVFVQLGWMDVLRVLRADSCPGGKRQWSGPNVRQEC